MRGGSHFSASFLLFSFPNYQNSVSLARQPHIQLLERERRRGEREDIKLYICSRRYVPHVRVPGLLEISKFSCLFICSYLSHTSLKAMEASQPLSIESFSYSWLVNLKPASLESLNNSLRTSLDASDESSFIEMDPTMPPSQRFFMNSQQDFKFDFPAAISQSPLTTLVHADELISNGYLLPLSVESLMKMEAYHCDEASNFTPVPSHLQKDAAPTDNHNSRDCSKSLRRCRRLSRRIFEKYLNFLRPLYRRIRGDRNHHHKANPKGGNLDKRSHSVKNCRVHSSETSQSPRISVAYSADDWRMSCDSESSIYEAVLHCKRSIGK